MKPKYKLGDVVVVVSKQWRDGIPRGKSPSGNCRKFGDKFEIKRIILSSTLNQYIYWDHEEGEEDSSKSHNGEFDYTTELELIYNSPLGKVMR
jgi:hypothetical protein